MDAVLAPKVYGTLHLDDATKEEDLDLFVLFSSISAVLGGVGLGDYAYANSFLDSFTEKREILRKKGDRSGKTLSINWPHWQGGGMKVSDQTEAYLINSLGLIPLETKEGLRVFDQGLRGEAHQFLVVRGDHNKLRRKLSGQDVGSFPTEQGAEGRTEDILDQLREVSAQERSALLTNYLWKTVAEILKVEPSELDAEEPLTDMGLDSIMAAQLRYRLSDSVGVEVTMEEFIKGVSIDTLSKQVLEELADELSSSNVAPDSQEGDFAEVENLSTSESLPGPIEPDKSPQNILAPSSTEQGLRQYKESKTLLPLQTAGTRRPLFCVHPADGSVFWFGELARQLGSDQPFYGLQAHGLDSTSPLSRVEDMATEYIDAIRTVQPKAPYVLGGFCGGGTIALEMSQQLKKQGDEVDLLILFDIPAPHNLGCIFEDEISLFIMFLLNFGVSTNNNLLSTYCELRGIDETKGVEGVRRDVGLLSYQERL